MLVVTLAFIVPVLLARFRRIPVVVGEIIAGIVVGPSIFGLVHGDEPTLELLAEIGFAFLMFLSGLEIDFSILFAASQRKRRNGPGVFLLATISFMLTLGLALALGFGLTRMRFVRDPWMMTLILSTTSLGIVVPVLKERRLSSGRFGQAILLAALLADFLTMFLITVYVAVRSTGLTLDILLIVLLFIPVILFYQVGVRWLRVPAVRRFINDMSDATAQLKVRGAFAIMIAFVVMAELLGAELILGAFLGGVVASLLSGKEEENLRHKLDAIGFGFFIPLFFIFVGVQFDLNAFIHESSAWVLLPILLVGSFGIKLLSTLVFRATFSWRETIASGFLLSARLSLIIAASAIGLRLGVISESTNAAVILVAALTATLAPFAFNSLHTELKGDRRQMIVIFGESELALQVAGDLKAHGEQVCFIETDMEAAEHIESQNFHVEKSSRGLGNCFDRLQAADVEAFLALSTDEEENLRACRSARAQGIDHVVSFVIEPKRLPDFWRLGVQSLTPLIHRSSLLALMARNRSLFELLTSTTDEHDLQEMQVHNKDLAGKRLRELKLPGDVRILAIHRDDETIVPYGGSRLLFGDRIVLIGDLEGLSTARSMLG